ncbi:MAG: GGDEF domain-containing protein [Clostridia bacterium]|nr:GGDEF domain-containing protein [Clostridia bacterium]
MGRELTALDTYNKLVYKIVMLIVPAVCLLASFTITILNFTGFFPGVDKTYLLLFNVMDLSFLGLGIYFILTGFDKDGMLKENKLFFGKYTIALIAVLQWNGISYIWPFRELWVFILLFLLGEAFFFDLRLVQVTSAGLLISLTISWIINPEVLLPIRDDYFVANMAFRILCLLFTTIGVNLLSLFGGRFLMNELEKYVSKDPLTELFTRRKMNLYLQNAYNQSKSGKKSFCLLMLDIDDFKKVNDTYGHDCGDAVLKLVAGIVLGTLKPDDKAFRWGGEEILILMEGDKEEGIYVAEIIRDRIEQQFIFYKGQEPVRVTVTIGMSELDSGLSMSRLMEIVDKNLYKGKGNGKNQVVFH